MPFNVLRRLLLLDIRPSSAQVQALLCSKLAASDLISSHPSMPRARQRIVTCDCLDCRDDPVISTSTESTSTAANEAAARQEPPPKSLFIIASGFLQPGSGDEATSLEAALLPHLDKCAVQGSANLAACRPKECDRDASCVELKEVLGLITVSSSPVPTLLLLLLQCYSTCTPPRASLLPSTRAVAMMLAWT